MNKGKIVTCVRRMIGMDRAPTSSPDRICKINIMSTQLFLMRDEFLRPPNSKRIGSVKVIFPDQTEQTIRVFGFLGNVSRYATRVAIEKQLRAYCESAEVSQTLFDHTGDPVFAKRFCPSHALVINGWRSRNGELQRRHEARSTH